MESLTGSQFWEIKHRTDDLIDRLGWTTAYAKQYIQCYYGCQSRLSMTDEQLRDLLNTLEALSVKKTPTVLTNKKPKRNKSRRK